MSRIIDRSMNFFLIVLYLANHDNGAPSPMPMNLTLALLVGCSNIFASRNTEMIRFCKLRSFERDIPIFRKHTSRIRRNFKNSEYTASKFASDTRKPQG